ncbi:MAG TPA: hypothetical protein VF748_10710, partial [Candidatus Acidoferrum sp.]
HQLLSGITGLLPEAFARKRPTSFFGFVRGDLLRSCVAPPSAMKLTSKAIPEPGNVSVRATALTFYAS